MQTFWKTTANLSLYFLIALLVFCVSPAFAQRNDSRRAQRRFSYEPISFQVGDHVQISTAETNVMKGAETVGTLKQGESFQITKVMGQWLGISSDHNGQKINGWVFQGHVTAPGSATNPPVAPRVERRAYSYQPSSPNYNYYGGNYYDGYYNRGFSHQPWLYPKSNMRRYDGR
jgi:hypothetical protein